MENGDIGVILNRGQQERLQIPFDAETGTVVIALGVDDDHDEVFFTHRGAVGTEEVIGQALEALNVCRHALTRLQKA